MCTQSCPTLSDSMDCNPPGSFVHVIFQARILEWVVIPSSRGSSWPRNWTCISVSLALAGRFFTSYATWEALKSPIKLHYRKERVWRVGEKKCSQGNLKETLLTKKKQNMIEGERKDYHKNKRNSYLKLWHFRGFCFATTNFTSTWGYGKIADTTLLPANPGRQEVQRS